VKVKKDEGRSFVIFNNKPINNSMASNEAELVENAVSKLYYLQFITLGISTVMSISDEPNKI